MKEKFDELDFLKIKNFCYVKDTVKRMKRLATDREKVFAKHLSDKGLISKIYKELKKATLGKQTGQLKNGLKI